MYNINTILTRHAGYGHCNSNALYNIIESIGPEIIFEAVPPSYLDRYYVSKTQRNLESETINKYIEKYRIQHIPVDSDDVPPDSFFNDLQDLYRRVEGLADINGYNYRTHTDSLSENINPYTKAVFLIGSGHINSIMPKINDYRTKIIIIINWISYNKIDQ